MGKKRGPERLSCRALDFLEPLHIDDEPADTAAVFESLATSRSPLAVGLELRSSPGFIDTVVSELVRQGVPQSALAIAGLVLAKPTVAVKKAHGPGARLLQACLIQMGEDDECLRVVIHAKLAPGKPPQVEDIAVDVDLIDPVSNPDEALAQLEQWHRDYPNPTKSPPENYGPRVIGWFGEPQSPLHRDWPYDWQLQVETVARIFGVEIRVAKSLEVAGRMSLTASADLVFVLGGGKRSQTVLDKLEQAGGAGRAGCKFVVLAEDGGSFEATIGALRGGVLDEFTESGPQPRDLLPGEQIYHRKIRTSHHFDLFDEGSSQPCKHGKFKSWSGDKAVKGMLLRYPNFQPRMLRHCVRYPNCGMYSVDASSLRDPDIPPR